MKILKKVVSIVIVGVLSINCLSNYTRVFAEEPYDVSMWNYRGSNEINTIFAQEVLEILGVDSVESITKDDLLRITELDLSGKGLSEIPYVINLFPNLETLIVDDNEIPYLHNDIKETLLDLDYFSICNNYLLDVDNSVLREFGIDSFKYNILDTEYQYDIVVDPSIEIDYLTAIGENSEEYLRSITDLVLDDTIEENFENDITTHGSIQVYDTQAEDKKEIPEFFDLKAREVEVPDYELINYFGINETIVSEHRNLYQISSQQEALNQVVDKYKSKYRSLEVYLEVETYEVVGIDTEIEVGSGDIGGGIEITTPPAISIDTPVTLPIEWEDGVTVDPPLESSGELTKDVLYSGIMTLEEYTPVTLPVEREEDVQVTTPPAIDVLPVFPSTGDNIKYNLQIAQSTMSSQSSLVFATLNSSDTIPPVVLGVIQSTNEWTSEPVTITVDAQDYGIGSDGSVLVSFDGGAFSSTRSLTVTNNRTVAIRVKDKVGNEVSLNYSVKNIDKDKPLAPNVKVYAKDTGKPVSEHVNSKGWVNKIITVESLNREDARGGNTQAPIDYLFIELSDGTRLQENDIDRRYIENLNDTFRCGYVDKAGNVSSLTAPMSLKVDTEKPKILSHNSISGTDFRIGYWNLNDYSDNMTDTLQLTIDNQKTWETIVRPNKVTKSFIQPSTLYIYLKDDADNISDQLKISIQADNVAPILTGYKLVPDTWTNGMVKLYPVGDTTGSSWWGKKLNGVSYDVWSNIGFIPVYDNFTNYSVQFSDRASNWAKETIYATVDNIDKDLPYLDNIQVVDKGNGTCDVIVNGKDDLSGIHATQGYSINGGKFSSSNKVNIPISNTDKTIDYTIQDKATNKYSGSVVVKNGVALGAPAVLVTDKEFAKWGNKDHTISMSGGYSPQGISHYEYRIKTIRNGLGETVNTYSEWTKYTKPFVISQEGELEVESRIVPKAGTNYVYGSEKVWIDKTKPSKPIADQWNIIDGVRVPYKATSVPTKFAIYSKATNFYTADSLSGVELLTTRVADGKPVGNKYTTPVEYGQSNSGGNNYFYFFDKAGNYSAGLHLGENGRSYKPYKLSELRSTTSITDKPIEVTFKLKDDYYQGFRDTPVSGLYNSLPYTTSFLNDKPNSEDYIDWYNTNPNVSTNGIKEITTKYTVSENGTYYFYARDKDDQASSFSFTVDNIDLEAPVIKSVNVSNTKPTNGTVTITVSATDDCHQELLQYSFDGGVTYTSSNSIVINNNQTVDIRVKDGFNRVTSHPTININNIDKDKPVMKSIDTQKVNAIDVRMTIVAEDVGTSGLEDKFISYNDGEWCTSLQHVAKYNIATKISIRDKAGNISDTFISVNTDDSVMIVPVISSSVANGSWNTESVRLTIDGGVMPSGLKGYEYSINNGSWQPYNVGTGVELENDGTYEVKARALGLGGEVGATSNPYVVNIDKTAPKFKVTVSSTEWTNGSVTLQISEDTDGKGIGLHDRPYSFDGTTWTNSKTYEVNESKLYYVRVRDALGNVSRYTTVPVNNIDKQKPTLNDIVSVKFADGTDFNYQGGAWANKPVTVTFNASDSESGIAYSEFDSGAGWLKTLTTNTLRYDTVGTRVKFRTYDKAGNVSDVYTAPLIKVDITVPSIKNVTGYSEPWYKSTKLVVDVNTPQSWLSPITQYSFDGGSTWQSSNTKLIDKTGTYIIIVKNEAGTQSAPKSVKVNIDSTAPTISSVEGNPTEWQKEDVTLTVNATDTQSGIKEYSFDDGATWQKDNKKVFSRNTVAKIKVRDNVGNVSAVNTVNITKIDKDVPIIKGVKSVKFKDGTDFDYSKGEFASKALFVTFNIEETGSGLEKLEYSKDGGISWIDTHFVDALEYWSVGAPLKFRSTDKLGNISSTFTAPLIKVDCFIPEINSVIGVNSTDWYKNPKVTVNATTEGITGIKEFSCDNGKTWQSSNVFTLNKNGVNTYNFIAKSGTDNISSVHSMEVKVDNKVPDKPTINLKGKQFEDLSFNITGINDSDSGVASVQYKIGDSSWKTYTEGDIAVNSVEPNLVIKVKVTDNVGNFIETQQTVNINLLDVAIPLSVPLEVNSNRNVHTTYLNIQNNGTPIDIELSVDDSNGIPLISDTVTNWNELTSEQSIKKAQMVLNVESGSELLYGGYLDNQILLNSKYMLGSLKNGLLKYRIELFTGSSWQSDMNKSYTLNFKVTSKYQ